MLLQPEGSEGDDGNAAEGTQRLQDVQDVHNVTPFCYWLAVANYLQYIRHFGVCQLFLPKLKEKSFGKCSGKLLTNPTERGIINP